MEITHDTLRAVRDGDLESNDLRKHIISTITKVDYIAEPISYDHFFRNYLLPNKICVLGPWATENWQSQKEWVNGDGTPNLEFIKERFGHVQCPVAQCDKEEYSAHPKLEMSVEAYIDYLQDYTKAGYPKDSQCLYLKDWHFQRLFPDYGAYVVPPFFASDWMNEFWDLRDDVSDDYRFVYMGPKGSWTPFHSDVFRSHSWSANICGRKKWIFYPPGEENHLKDIFGHLPFDLTSADLKDRSRFPAVDQVKKRFEVYQERGEVVFVPSGWHHQVFNLENTISINHNWMNGSNIDLSWCHLVDSLRDVQKEIADCRDMDGWGAQCQLILKANAGMDYTEFYRYLEAITKRRTEAILEISCNDESEPTFRQNNLSAESDNTSRDKENNDTSIIANSDDNKLSYTYSNHYIFDLVKIKDLVFEMKRNKEFLEIDLDQFDMKPRKLINFIEETIDKFEIK